MLGVPGEQPLTISVTELSPAEAQQLLRQMSQVPTARLVRVRVRDSYPWLGLGLAIHNPNPNPNPSPNPIPIPSP